MKTVKETKLKAVKEHLDDGLTIKEVCEKYKMNPAVLNLIKVRAIITKAITILAIANAITLLAAFIVALIMNGSDILPEYCSGNPECSIRSLIIIPSLVSVLIAIFNGILSKKLVVKEE